jgi:putative ABC transport system permease protein
MNSELRLVLLTLLRYYRRAPGQALFLLLGLGLGVLMLSGIHVINERARASYAAADSAFGQQERYRIEAVAAGDTVPEALYVDLRRRGIDRSLPVLEGSLRSSDGRLLRLTGVDPLALPAYAGAEEPIDIQLGEFLRPPFLALAGARAAARLQIEDGAFLSLADGRRFGPVRHVADDPLLGSRLLVDIGAAQQLLGAGRRLSWISLFELDDRQRQWLLAELPPSLRLVPMNDPDELEQLTRSFHLNLTAMGLLAFIVGLFIVYNAVNFTVLQRRPLIARLRLLGLSEHRVRQGLILELALFVLVGTGLGFAAGVALAGALSPTVTDTLETLYGARLADSNMLRARWFIEALVMAAAGAALAGGRRLWQLSRTPPLTAQTASGERGMSRADRRWLLRLAPLALVLGLLAHLADGGVVAGFASIAGVLLAAALLLPPLLEFAAACGARLLRRRPLTHWACADAGARMGRLGVAMMALLLAMAANVGINTMVGSFRLTFLDWLEQRLSAQVYLRPPPGASARLIAELEGRDGIAAVARFYSTDGQAQGAPAEIIGLDLPAIRASQVLKESTADWPAALGDGAVLISEKFAFAFDLAPGDRLRFGDGSRQLDAPIAGVVYDYGAPRGLVLLQERHWTAHWPGIEPTSLGLYLEPDHRFDLDAFRERYDLTASQVIDQQSVKQLSVSIFDRTFAVTRSMNLLTLLVAAIGLACALLATEGSRSRDLAQLRALGVGSRALAAAGAGQVLALTALTAALAVPLGVLLAWQLVNVVNVAAFGWSFPLRLFPGEYLRLGALCMLAGLLAAAWPNWRQARTPCARWLQLDTG